MKYLLIFLLMASCSKNDTLPEYVTVRIYISQIEGANHNEPNPLYTYVYTETNDRYYIASTTDLNRDIATLEFRDQLMLPTYLYKASKLKDITVKRILITKE